VMATRKAQQTNASSPADRLSSQEVKEAVMRTFCECCSRPQH
jgi:hypothetical protein